MSEDVSEKTRDVYLEQHKNYLKDDVLLNRYLGMTEDPSYYHMTREDFQGLSVLDAGCGNSAYLEINLHRLGCGHITCLELGEDWIPELKSALIEHDVPEDKVTYVSGSTDDLPFPDEHFDLVFSNGVLMHLNDVDQSVKAFKELSRVTKIGGQLYGDFGMQEGLIESSIIKALRKYYRSNKEFEDLIDNISPSDFKGLFEFMAKGMREHTEEEFNYAPLLSLFDLDLCTTIQNLIQVPKRYLEGFSVEWVLKQFEENGFSTPRQCIRYVKRKNIRKYLAPLHYDRDNKFSKILYGYGNLEYIATKTN